MSDSLQPHRLQYTRLPCLSLFVCQSLLKFTFIELMILSNHIILCCTLLSCLQFFPTSGSFQWVSSLHQVAKVLELFSISPSDEYSGLISIRINQFHLLAFQGILKSLLQHHNSKALILQCSGFFMVRLSHWYMTLGKTINFDDMGLCQQRDVPAF